MAVLDFPVSAKKAARELVEGPWGHNLYQNLEELIDRVQVELYNEVCNWNTEYGVEDAILAGTQMRLLDQIDLKKARMNCGEIGVNLFLIYAALGVAEKVRLMRFNDGRDAEHFSVLYFDQGLDQDPVLLDPLWQLDGRIKFTPQGYIYTPLNLLPENNPEGKKYDENTHQRIVHLKRTNISLLTLEDVVRHVNFMNSPSGFFKFFDTGQKIKTVEYEGFSIEYWAKTKGNTLLINATCMDEALDMFTFQRSYTFKDGKVQPEDDTLIHLGYEWTPKQILYSKNTGVQTDAFGCNEKNTIAFVAYARSCLNPHMKASTGQDRRNILGELNDEFETEREQSSIVGKKVARGFGRGFRSGIVDIIQKHGSEIDDELAKGASVEIADYVQSVYLKHDPKYQSFKETKAVMKYLSGMNCADRERYIDHLIFFDKFSSDDGQLKSRKIRAKKPYSKFRPDENPVPFFQNYTEYRYRLFKNKIDEFFNSEVAKKLVNRYQEIMELRCHVGLAA